MTFWTRERDEDKPFSEKLADYLTSAELGGVIRDSFSHKEIARLMASLGAVYPGIRIESVSHEELAQGFAEDALKDPVLLASLEKALDKVHEPDLEEIRSLSPKEIKEILSRVPEILERRGVGKLVWVLLKDPRPEVRELIRPFIKSVCRFGEQALRKLEDAADFRKRFEEGRLGKAEVKEVKHELFSLYRELKEVQKKLQEKEKKMGALWREQDRLKEDLSRAKRENSSLAASLGQLRKELIRKETVIGTLEETGKKLSRTEEKGLRRQLHDLEREHRKQEHEILKAREKISELEGERDSNRDLYNRLAKDCDRLLQEKALLGDQLAQLIKERDETKQPVSIQLKTQSHSKEKGKRLGIFVDMQNIWIAARRLERKIDFGKLLDSIVLGRHLVKAIAYVVVVPGLEQESFFNMLKRKGFEVRYRTLIRRADGSAKGNWDTGMVVDAIHLVDKNDLDIVHVVSGDGDFIDLLKFLKTKGVRVEASGFPFNTAQDLLKCVDDFFPLSEGVLKERELMGASSNFSRLSAKET